jgi:outer membrane lipoprotein-sorting protein
MTTLIALVALALPKPAPTIDEVLQTNFKDATFEVKVVQKNQGELGKINKSFGDAYRFDQMKAFLKEPMMIRLESRVGDSEILFILNGFNRLMRVPRANFSQRENLKNDPGKVQSLMDFGILTGSLMRELFTATYLRTDRASGNYVFDLNYLAKFKDTSKFRIWVDPAKKYITKRESHNRKGEQRATFFYDEPIQSGGVWMPSRVTVRNMENKVAGVTDYRSAKINTGLSDSLFKT